jgi:hypothetical protein
MMFLYSKKSRGSFFLMYMLISGNVRNVNFVTKLLTALSDKRSGAVTCQISTLDDNDTDIIRK